jgi:hypothetical protein
MLKILAFGWWIVMITVRFFCKCEEIVTKPQMRTEMTPGANLSQALDRGHNTVGGGRVQTGGGLVEEDLARGVNVAMSPRSSHQTRLGDELDGHADTALLAARDTRALYATSDWNGCLALSPWDRRQSCQRNARAQAPE